MDRHSIKPDLQLSLAAQQTGVSVERIFYHGWPDCYRITNESVEATIVPAIGRVMQLRLKTDADGTFWEDRALDGQLHAAALNDWLNFGGDKCWPAPQAHWARHLGRDWPPPAAFDAQPFTAAATRHGVVLASAVDPDYGIQVVRHLELDAAQPILRIETEYRKLFGQAVRVGVWTITQMREPERICIHFASKSKFAAGYLRLLAAEPADLKIDGRLLSFRRNKRQQVKIGSDGSSLAWVGQNCVVRIDAEIEPGEYPDGGCVAEVYTNPDPLKYVELETLGPLTAMNAGDQIRQTTVYTVTPRSTSGLEAEARQAFGEQ